MAARNSWRRGPKLAQAARLPFADAPTVPLMSCCPHPPRVRSTALLQGGVVLGLAAMLAMTPALAREGPTAASGSEATAAVSGLPTASSAAASPPPVLDIPGSPPAAQRRASDADLGPLPDFEDSARVDASWRDHLAVMTDGFFHRHGVALLTVLVIAPLLLIVAVATYVRVARRPSRSSRRNRHHRRDSRSLDAEDTQGGRDSERLGDSDFSRSDRRRDRRSRPEGRRPGHPARIAPRSRLPR